MASTSAVPSASQHDPLSLVLQHAASSSLDSITYTSADGSAASDLLSSAYVHFPPPSTPQDGESPSQQVTFPRSTRTRVLRSRNSAALQSTSTSTPEQPDDDAQADEFLPLDALLFVLITREEASGLYAVKATRERVARVDTLDRPSLLDLLAGNKSEADCEVVLAIAECQSRRQRKEAQQAGGAALASTSAGAAVSVADTAGEAGEGVRGSDVGGSTGAATAASTSTGQQDQVGGLDGSTPGLHPLIASGKRPYAPSKQDAAFVKRLRASEVVLRDRTWAFRCTVTRRPNGGDEESDDEGGAATVDDGSATNLNGTSSRGSGAGKDVDFTALRRSVTGRITAARSSGGPAGASSGRSAGATSSSTAAPTSTLGRSAKHRRLDPIIILPSSPSSLLTLANIKRFLEEGQFDAPQLAATSASSMNSSTSLAPTGGSNEVVVINRPKGGRFLAVDSVDALARLGGSAAARSGAGGAAGSDPSSSDVWRRVVCVITTGQKWQFRGYKWEQGRDLFRNVFGVCPRLSNQPKDTTTPGGVRDWNVLDLSIDSSKRHLDSQISGFFWRQLEAWIQRRKPELAPPAA